MESTLPPDSTQHGLRPIVSICIANYNGIDMIDGCIESVRSQDCGFAFEIIVHDDASSDGSADHIRERHPDVLLIESPENVGFCVANNRMAAAASGKYLLLLNNDAELFPDALRCLHREAQRKRDHAILGLPQFDFDTGKLIDRGCILDPFFNPVPNLAADRTEVAMVIGACLWVPKRLWDQLGGFPEWFGSIAEDLFLCCHARLAGYSVRILPVSGFRHRYGMSFGGGKVRNGGLVTTRRRRALSERNKSRVMLACQPAPLLLLQFPAHIVSIIIEGLLLSTLKKDFTLWQDIYAPLLPALWRDSYSLKATRREVQSSRRISTRAWLAAFTWVPWKLRMLFRYGVPTVR
jgi:GT2 family glycosyltransferase